jgi:hypothetical protein
MSLLANAEAFARRCHAGQTRKGAACEPYTTHLEEVVLLLKKWGASHVELAAGWLHDTVEDCPPVSFADITLKFGDAVCAIVRELTDDKTLPKADRKRLQIEQASSASKSACLVKLADKTSNVGALGVSPPSEWSLERRLQYVTWAEAVVQNLPYKPEVALAEFLRRCDIAILKSYEDLGTVRQAQNAALALLERKAQRIGSSPERVNQLLLSMMKQTL